MIVDFIFSTQLVVPTELADLMTILGKEIDVTLNCFISAWEGQEVVEYIELIFIDGRSPTVEEHEAVDEIITYYTGDLEKLALGIFWERQNMIIQGEYFED